jgi:hypothetical protein
MDAAERQSHTDLVEANAAREVEIERNKQAALQELRASVKAGDLQAQAEAAAAALDAAVAVSSALVAASLAAARLSTSISMVSPSGDVRVQRSVVVCIEVVVMVGLRSGPDCPAIC